MKTMLLVEDEDSIVTLVRRMLDAGGKNAPETLLTTAMLAEAKSLAQTHQPDLILLDLTLCDAGNLETMENIPFFDALAPVVILSGGTESDFAKCHEKGALACLYKPVWLRPGYEAYFMHALQTARAVWSKRPCR